MNNIKTLVLFPIRKFLGSKDRTISRNIQKIRTKVRTNIRIMVRTKIRTNVKTKTKINIIKMMMTENSTYQALNLST